jgi:FAD dependent oxidoreductase TIGR03364
MDQSFDDAIVGAGIIGLAHAYHLAMRGRRVIVCERSPQAQGASVRNFGMIWPIGQPAGVMYDLARRSREIWLEVLAASGLWHERTGSLHLAYHDDEAQVLREFMAAAPADAAERRWLNRAQVFAQSPAVQAEGLRGAMWSSIETCVDPREIIAHLPVWLDKKHEVKFVFNCAATSYANGRLTAGGHLQTLFPTVYQESGLFRCKLQMMRAKSHGEYGRIGPMLAAGLTLAHYKSFQDCPSLPALKKRFAAGMGDYVRYGIHVMVSQNGLGELTLGDSHEYGPAITPFDKEEIDNLVLRYLSTFLRTPNLQITSRWNGVYVKHPTDPYFIARPATGVTIVTGVGGAGMTLSFGLAEKVILENLGEA